MSLTFVRIAPKTSEHLTPTTQTKMWESQTNPTNRDLYRPAWSHKASAAFIDIMEGFMDDLEHPAKRKQVFKNANKILMSMGFTGYTPLQCQQKWKSLLRTYRANKYSTNKGKCRFYFYDNMEKFLSNRPQIVPKLTVESNDTNSFVVENLTADLIEEPDDDPLHGEDIQNECTVQEEDSGETLNQILEYTIEEEENDKTINATVSDNEPMECPESNDTEIITIDTPNRTGWSYQASVAFINIMEDYLEDLEHPGKRKNVWNNVCQALISMGIDGFTPGQCQHKWKNLLRTYKLHKVNKNRVGQSKRFYFFDQMDKLLGNNYKIAEERPKLKFVKIEGPTTPKFVRIDSASAPKIIKIERAPNGVQMANTPANTLNPVNTGNAKPCVVMMCSHEDLREKARQKRHDERMALEKERCQIERRKVALLEKILAKLA